MSPSGRQKRNGGPSSVNRKKVKVTDREPELKPKIAEQDYPDEKKLGDYENYDSESSENGDGSNGKCEIIDVHNIKTEVLDYDECDSMNNLEVLQPVVEVIEMKNEILDPDYEAVCDKTLPRVELELKEEPCEFDEAEAGSRQERGIKPKGLLCCYCSKTEANFQDLSMHVQVVHIDQGFFPCKLCPKIVSSRPGITAHMKRHRNGVFKCGYCKFETTTNYYLKLHTSAMHSDESLALKYKCGQCDVLLKTRSEVSRHNREVHNQTENVCFHSNLRRMWYSQTGVQQNIPKPKYTNNENNEEDSGSFK